MLVAHRRCQYPALDVHYRCWSLASQGLWIDIVRSRNAGGDDALVPNLAFGRPASGRRLVGVTLAGRSHVRVGHRCVDTGAGTVIATPGRGAYKARVDGSSEEHLSITIECDERWSDTRPPEGGTWGSLGAVERLKDTVTALCQGIEQTWCGATDGTRLKHEVVDLFARLRADGVACPSAESIANDELDTKMQAIVRAVDLALSDGPGVPALVDVTAVTGGSTRAVQRHLPRLCAAFGRTTETFRQMRQRAQLGHAINALSHPKSTTEGVAAWLGYSSPNAFCRTMRHHGLPVPSHITAHFRA